MYLINSSGDNIFSLTRNVTTPTEDYYHRATIDDHGNFQRFVYHKSTSSRWTRVRRAIDDPCRVNSVWGVNGMCTSSDDETVTCNCVSGYTPLEPSDVLEGCHPETVVNYCAEASSKNFTVEVVDDAGS